jgi:molecular chaperone GrpE (heat shock protein)
MDSLQLYTSVYQSAGLKYDRGKLKKVDEIVQCIIEEIMVEPYDLNKSPFIKEAVRLVRYIKMSNGMNGIRICLYPYDAYVIIKALGEKIHISSFSVATSMDYQEYASNLFKRMQFRGDQQEKMTEVNMILKEIQKFIDEKKEKAAFDKRRIPESYGISNGRSMVQPGMDECTRKMSGGIQSKSAQGELSRKSYSTISSEKILERSNNCKENVQRWHDENQVIVRKLNEIQPSISEILQKIMRFSDEITESYILQFAKMQIELFNLIADNFQYHLNAVTESNNQDYYNAVLNYQDFMDTIIDNLSAFGIEEITSRAGSRFDGNLHEVMDSTDFSPRLSSVKESVRTGFKYKDIIIQKERIRV